VVLQQAVKTVGVRAVACMGVVLLLLAGSSSRGRPCLHHLQQWVV
jgi:hypothetical protein